MSLYLIRADMKVSVFVYGGVDTGSIFLWEAVKMAVKI
jgi:hypothetical protein